MGGVKKNVGVDSGGENEMHGTNHVTSGPMRGLKKCTRWHKQTHRNTFGHGDSMTESAQLGQFSENH